MIRTNEGALQYEHSMDHALEFFSKAGSLFTNKSSFYGNEETALSLFQKVWVVDKETAFKLLLWLRDCRGGAGNRSAFRECLQWVAEQNSSWVRKNINWVPKVGRWDDLRCLFNTNAERTAARYWADAVNDKNVLAAKWADRKDKPLKHALGIKKEGTFRKLLANIRKRKIVEHKMSTKRWRRIEYNKVPSVAMARYTNAFERHDPEGFCQFKDDLAGGKTKVNAKVLFPHDCVRTARGGDQSIADAQFEALPNYMEGTNERVMVVADTSGSMSVPVAGSIKAVDVSQALALYCSSRIEEGSPFHKKFIGFASESELKDWEGRKFSDAVTDRGIFDRAIGYTNIGAALERILHTAGFFKLPQKFMPTTLLIVSDMEFSPGAKETSTSEVQTWLDKWVRAGYKKPKIIYWNLAGYAGQPDTALRKDVALISGFSPSVLKAVLSGEDFSPIAIMNRALEKYKIRVPKDSSDTAWF